MRRFQVSDLISQDMRIVDRTSDWLFHTLLSFFQHFLCVLHEACSKLALLRNLKCNKLAEHYFNKIMKQYLSSHSNTDTNTFKFIYGYENNYHAKSCGITSNLANSAFDIRIKLEFMAKSSSRTEY